MQVSNQRSIDATGSPVEDVTAVGVTATSVPAVEEASDLAEVFRLLGSPKRIRLLYALAEAGELCVSELAAVVHVSETSVSQSMRLLRTAGVVRKRRIGRNILYRLDDGHVEMLLEVSRAHLSHREI